MIRRSRLLIRQSAFPTRPAKGPPPFTETALGTADWWAVRHGSGDMDAPGRAEELVGTFGNGAMNVAKTALSVASLAGNEPAVSHWAEVLVVLYDTDAKRVAGGSEPAC